MLAIDVEKELQEDFPGLFADLDKATDWKDCMSRIYRRAAKENLTYDAADQLVVDAYTLHQWRQNRVIYSFQPELFRELVKQASRADEDDLLPAELLENLPYPCFAVEGTPILMRLHDRASGEELGYLNTTGRFFVYVQPEGIMFDSAKCLTAVFESADDGKLLSYMLPITGTLRESTETLQQFLESQKLPDEEVHKNTATIEIILPMIAAQCVLYLQAINADTQSRPTAKRKKSGAQKPAQKPPKVVDVGIRVSAAIRKAKEQKEPDAPTREGFSNPGTPKRPHSRRGHWHRYWTGSESAPETRKIIIKWVAPTMIHGDAKSESTTLVPVKK